MVAAGALAQDHRDELLRRVGVVFARREPRLQAGRYVAALTAEVPRKNGWQIAEWVGDATPDRTQRLLNHAVWDEHAAMGVVAGFVAEQLRVGDDPLAVVVLDESGQEKRANPRQGSSVSMAVAPGGFPTRSTSCTPP
jgi:hypothetical protein